MSEKKREREVLQYVAAYRDLPRLDALFTGPDASLNNLPADHDARPSTDPILTALCQLAALRTNAQRASISLIDDTNQHVLAEATTGTSLRSGFSSGTGTDSLWLGSVSVPRSWGVDEQVLALDARNVAGPASDGTSIVVNKDLRDSRQHAQRTYVRESPRVRFQAGAALVSPHGAIIGALSIFDHEPRHESISHQHAVYLEDLAATVVEYLGNYIVKDRFKRGEKLTRGLISFAEGASALQPLETTNPFDLEPRSPTTTSSTSFGSDAGPTSTQDVPTERPPQLQVPEAAHAPSSASRLSQAGSEGSGANPDTQRFSVGSDTVRAGSTRDTSLRALQDTILPMNSRSMFARAANVLLASSELDGVMILDASVAATGHRQHPAAPERERLSGNISDSASPNSKSESSEDSSSQSGNAKKNANSSSSKKCGILGTAPSRPVVNVDGTPGVGSLTETNLARLLREYPHGKVFNYTVQGVSMSSTDDSSSAKGSHGEFLPSRDDSRPAANKRHGRASRSSKTLAEFLPGARSVAFVPFWDYVSQRESCDIDDIS